MELNSLSWLIYLAEAAEKAGNVATGASILWLLIGGGFSLFFLCCAADGSMRKTVPAIFIPIALILELTFVSVAVIIPSQRTILMIAASEAGETVVDNPETREVFNDLKDILKNKLKEMKE